MKHILRMLKRSMPLPQGMHPYRLRSGVGKGVVMEFDLSNKLQRAFGLEEREIQLDFRRLVLQSAALVDIGASDGLYPLLALNVNPSICCTGLDPCAEMERRAQRNRTLNEARLPVQNVTWCKDMVGTKYKTLDQIAKDLPRPLLIKMDIDGGELDALTSGIETLKEANVALIVEIHSYDLERDCIALLTGLGYHCTVRRNAWWRAILPEERSSVPNHWFVAERV